MFKELTVNFNILKEDIILPDTANLYISKFDITEVLKYLKNKEQFLFERLDCIICKDTGEFFENTYLLHSDKYNMKCAISCKIEYNEAEISTVSEIFKSAVFDEREIFDLFGVKFINHPELKRILLPESFLGYPLRKNYTMNDERLSWNYDS